LKPFECLKERWSRTSRLETLARHALLTRKIYILDGDICAPNVLRCRIMGELMEHALDDPIWSALSGPNSRFAIGQGRALHFQRNVAPFSAISEPSSEAYADLAVHLPAGALARLFRPLMEPLPSGWEHVEDFPLLQMVAGHAPTAIDLDSVNVSLLTLPDVKDMVDLVEQTNPGPFSERTIELGTYVGIRENGRLIAMAGERMRVPGYVELSAICTMPSARGRGLATVLMRRLMRDAFARHETPFLHVAADNLEAVSVYERLGFRLRKTLHVLRRRPRQ
jgi:ribosomal protein S18 acetylase RimI-like enzyme